LTIAIVVLALCLVASLAFNFGFFGNQSRPAASGSNASNSPARLDVTAGTQDRLAKLEADLEKKRKEVEEVKKAHTELKDEHKAAKKRLHELKESDKDGDDLKKARAEVERAASVQLEQTRHELSVALAEVAKLKADADTKGKRAAAERPVEKVEKKEEVVTRVIRELSDVEKEKIARLEAMSASDKKKAIELTVELRNIKGRIDREKREAKRIYEEGRLARDKFRAVEMRLNRTLLENDLLKRAIADVEKRTGQHAEHTAPTAEEIAQSDASMTARHAAEDKAADEAARKLEEAEATNGDGTPAASPAPETTAAAAPSEVVPQTTA
jgi:chromosome segregation ATPase